VVAYNFPANPAQGDTYTSPDGKLTYGYNGFAWDMKAKTMAAQRPELIEISPFLVEAGATDVEILITGDLIVPTTKVIAIPNRGTGAELELPATFVNLTQISATFPNSTVVGQNTHDIYLETDGLRSQLMRQVCVAAALTHDYIDPVSVAAGSAPFELFVYFTDAAQNYPCNSGTVTVDIFWDGVAIPSNIGIPGGFRYAAITPDATPSTHELVAVIQALKGITLVESIPSHDPPMIFTYT
jgi:hypothetical protein